MAERKTISPVIRKQVLARDNEKCRKCCRQDQLQLHHLTPRRSKGDDVPDNLITLCLSCHAEWEMLDQIVHITFDEWLPLPTCRMLLGVFVHKELWTDKRSAKDTWEAIMTNHEMRKSMVYDDLSE